MKTKRTVTKTVTEEVEVPVNEVVEELFENNDWDPKNWDYTLDNFEDYFDYSDYEDVSEEDKDEVLKKAKEVFDEKVEKLKKEELNKLSTRQRIMQFISNAIDDSCYLEEGQIGYTLTTEEILDEILKNGNK